MKSKHIILFGALFMVAFNTLMGAVLSSYEMSSCGLVDLSICLSAGLLYYVSASSLVDGFKIGVSVLLNITGIVRAVLLGVMSTNLQNNILFLLAVLIFFLEIGLLFLVNFMNKK